MNNRVDPDTPSSPGPERPRLYVWAAWILVAGLAGWALYVLAFSGPPSGLPIAYSALVEQAQAGRVREVTIEGHRVTGSFTTPLELAGDRLLAPGAPLPPGVSIGQVRKGTDFATTIPEGAAAGLLPLLQRHGVTIEAKEAGDPPLSGLTLVLAVALPLLIAGLLLLRGSIVGRGRGPEDALGFARSRARTFQSERPSVTFADVAGEDEAKAQLAQVVDFLRHPARYHRLGARLPRGILLVGPPGTGKTLLAKAVAGEAGVRFFSTSASEFVELFVGVGASRVRDLFVRAREIPPAIVFIDELDAVGRQRSTGPSHGDSEREQTLNQLLVEMDGFDSSTNVIVIAATNRPDVLDPALLRPGRFDRQVTVGLPDRRGREAILRTHARALPLAPAVDLTAVAAATPGLAGADLANLVNEAALLAALEDKEAVDTAELEAAFDRVVLGGERPRLMSEWERRILAYHEAGHAIVAHFTPGADPLRKVSIVPRGRALGVTLQAPAEDRFNYGRADLLARLAVLLGGRAAECLVFGEATTGAENDLKEATGLARRMVGLWGMSDEVGPLFLGAGEQHAFLGGEIAQDREISEAMRERAEAAVERLLNEAMERAGSLLTARRDQLDLLAIALMAEETIGQAGIADLIGPSRSGATPARATTGAS